MREGGQDAGTITILADDPAAPAEIAALAEAQGWGIVPIPGGFEVSGAGT